MPIYQYRCSACEALHEVIAKMSDPAPERCESCQAEGTLQRQLSRSSFSLKGGGWYSDGYAGSSNQGPSSASSGSSGSGGSSGSAGGAS